MGITDDDEMRIEEHYSSAHPDDDKELHRIDQAVVEKLVTTMGFEVVARSELLRNPEDDRTKNVFDPTIRGKTDRFLLLLRRTS